MAVKPYEDFTGGLTTNNPRDVKDNQFVKLRNMYYNENLRLQSRRGTQPFGASTGSSPQNSIFSYVRDDTDKDILIVGDGTNLKSYDEAADSWDTILDWATQYDATVVLNPCEETSDGFTGTADANVKGFLTTDPKRGQRALEFDIGNPDIPTNPTGTTAVLTCNLSTAIDLTAYEDTGLIRFWFKAVDASKITNVEFRFGSSSSDYWSVTSNVDVAGSPIANAYRYLEFDWAGASETGTPDVTAVDYIQIIVNHTATTPIDALQIDQIAVYPSNNTATKRPIRWDFAVYQNSVLAVNGIDPYITLDTDEDPPEANIEGVIHGRFVQHLLDRLYISGDDYDFSKVDYTNASPSNADSSRFTNSVIVGGDEAGRVTGIDELASTILIGKEGKSYNLDVANATAISIDATNGVYGDRTIRSVGNGKVYQSGGGIETLQSRDGVSAAYALDSSPLTDDLRDFFNSITSRTRVMSASWYIKPLQQYYWSFDTNDDFKPDTHLVYSARQGVTAWSQYDLPALHGYCEYRDSSGNTRYLIANADVGQIYEIETGFTDNGAPIECELKTKEFDFGKPEITKEFHMVYILGQMSKNGEITVNIYVDGSLAQTETINNNHLDLSSSYNTVASTPIGQTGIGGGGSSDGVDIYQYKLGLPVYTGGQTIQVEMISATENQVWTLERMTFDYDDTSFDLFPFVIPS